MVALNAMSVQAQFHKKTESGSTAVVLAPKVGKDLTDLPKNVSFERVGFPFS
jgi:hypothetical protein